MIARANGHRSGHAGFSRLVDADGRPFPLRFGYDATENKKRRRPSAGGNIGVRAH